MNTSIQSYRPTFPYTLIDVSIIETSLPTTVKILMELPEICLEHGLSFHTLIYNSLTNQPAHPYFLALVRDTTKALTFFDAFQIIDSKTTINPRNLQLIEKIYYFKLSALNGVFDYHSWQPNFLAKPSVVIPGIKILTQSPITGFFKPNIPTIIAATQIQEWDLYTSRIIGRQPLPTAIIDFKSSFVFSCKIQNAVTRTMKRSDLTAISDNIKIEQVNDSTINDLIINEEIFKILSISLNSHISILDRRVNTLRFRISIKPKEQLERLNQILKKFICNVIVQSGSQKQYLFKNLTIINNPATNY